MANCAERILKRFISLFQADGQISLREPDLVLGEVPSRVDSGCHNLYRRKAALHQTGGELPLFIFLGMIWPHSGKNFLSYESVAEYLGSHCYRP